MNLYLMRHAEPTPGHPMDASRELTANGKQQAATMGEWLKRDIGRVDVVICSPFKRALQTAEIMGEALGAHVVSNSVLAPDGTPDKIWPEVERIAQDSKDVLIVGHMPSINALLLWLMESGESATVPAQIRFEHAALAYLKGSGSGDGALQWFIQPRIIEQPAEEKEVLEAARELAAAV